jgi:hypothetical protein
VETWVEFDTGDARFSLHAIPAEILAAIPAPITPVKPCEGSPTRLDFAVADVDSERGRLESLGVPILVRPWGSIDAVDPEGNVFGLRPLRPR